MGWMEQSEYLEIEVAPTVRVKKQIWDGEKFVSVTQYRVTGVLSDAQKDWLVRTFGQKGAKWNFTDSGRFYLMDDQVYMMFNLKWKSK